MVAFSNALPRPDHDDDLNADGGGEMTLGGDGVAGRIDPAGTAVPAGRRTTMRLTSDDGAEPVVGRIVEGGAVAAVATGGADRRVFPRRNLSLRVGGRRLDHSVDAHREPVLNLSLSDVSVGGLSAVSQGRMRVGERVAIFFPPEAGSRGWDAYGRVLRVDAAKAGYHVAVEFDPMIAA